METKELRLLADEVLQSREKARSDLNRKRRELKIGESYQSYNGQYEQMLQHVLRTGEFKHDRTGVKTIGIHGYQLRFDMDDGFPLITTKKLHTKSIIYENLWFLRGETNIKYLNEHGVTIWDEWADEEGNLGPVYGKQWRAWEGPQGTTIDQIQNVVSSLKNTPNSRRHIISAWNVGDLPYMALTPCHCLFQFHTSLLSLEKRNEYWHYLNRTAGADVSDDELDYHRVPLYRLDLQLYQRSCDIFLGVPFNIASYSMLLLMMAQVVNMKPGFFIHDYGDLHLYANHFDQAVEQLTRDPRPYPTLKLNPAVKSIFDFKFEDFTLLDYNPHPAIKASVAVG